MTCIKYTKDRNEITLKVSGHSGYDEIGKDIVCSACSTLVYTLIKSLSMKENVKITTEISEAYAYVKCKANSVDDYTQINIIFDTIYNGFLLLQEEFYDYVNIL